MSRIDLLSAAAAAQAINMLDFKKYDEGAWESHFDPEQNVGLYVAERIIAGVETDKDIQDLLAWVERFRQAPDTTNDERKWLDAIECNLR